MLRFKVRSYRDYTDPSKGTEEWIAEFPGENEYRAWLACYSFWLARHERIEPKPDLHAEYLAMRDAERDGRSYDATFHRNRWEGGRKKS